LNGPEISPAYILADTGLFDVWMINFRGNTYSRSHVFLDPEMQKEFWDFSFEEFGDFDLIAAIDYILKTTGKEKLSLVGYS
jgi:lysosomal acid lipase/cholesteryl ester hydrolase